MQYDCIDSNSNTLGATMVCSPYFFGTTVGERNQSNGRPFRFYHIRTMVQLLQNRSLSNRDDNWDIRIDYVFFAIGGVEFVPIRFVR